MKNELRMSGYNMAKSVIGLTQSMPLHILDCILYLTNIMKEIKWVRFDWTYLISDVFGCR